MLTPNQFEDLVRDALREDLAAGDITTDLLLGSSSPPGLAEITARQDLVVAGLPVARCVFASVDPGLGFRAVVDEGDRVEADTVLARVKGGAAEILKAERTALNFLGRLSGIATLTARYRQAMGEATARLLGTRKTTPGLRALENYALALGGGTVHRTDLYDGILVKDNHLAVAGGIRQALEALRRVAGPARTLEVEVENLAELEEALVGGADVVLLDNFSPEDLREAVSRAGGRARLEASGGVDLTSIEAVAATGVDAVSVGALTHSAPNADINLTLRLQEPG